MGHAFHVAEKSPSRSPGGTSSHAPMAMRQATFGNEDILQPKTDRCACGGSCPRCRGQLPIQKKLAISEPGDVYEQEADRVADEVLAAPAHSAVNPASPRIQRFAGQPAGQVEAAPPNVDQVLASPGRPLEPVLRHDMEQRFGHDFSRVRVHSGAIAEQSARDVNAQAYTVGHDVVFGVGRFAPGTNEGRRLIAHELTHVVQQSGADEIRLDQGGNNRGMSPLYRTLKIGAPDNAYEREADAVHVAQQRRSGVLRLQRAGIGEAKLADEWIVRMRTLRDAALGKTMKPAQEQEFVDGLNEVVQHSSWSSAAQVGLPVKNMPGASDAFEEGHVYFDKNLVYPGLTTMMCKTKGTKGFVPQKHYVSGEGYVKGTCSSDEAVGDVIFLGPGAILDTAEFTRSVFDHEAIHYFLGWQKRRGATNPIEGRLNEEVLAYAEEFARILAFSKQEMQTTVRNWMYYYTLATDSRAQKASELRIQNSLPTAYRRAGPQPDTATLRTTLAEAKAWAATPESLIDPGALATVEAAADRVVSILDLIEGRTGGQAQ